MTLGVNTYRIQPVRVHCLLAIWTFGYKHGPFAAMLAFRVLPLRFNAFFEQVKVCSCCYPAWGLDIIVQTAVRIIGTFSRRAAAWQRLPASISYAH